MAKLNITWPQFLYCNDNPTKAFEDMCRSIFYADILKRRERPHTDHNTPGVEVLPILESVCEGGQSVRTISFQAKYVEQASYAYTEFKKSARQTAKHFKGRLNKVYLFCNKTLTTTTKGYQEIVKIHRDAGIETVPISDVDLLDMINDYPDIAEYFFQKRRAADTSDLEVLLSSGITIYKIIEAFSGLQDTIQHQSADGGITKALVAEKLETCKKYTLEMEFKTLENKIKDSNEQQAAANGIEQGFARRDYACNGRFVDRGDRGGDGSKSSVKIHHGLIPPVFEFEGHLAPLMKTISQRN